MFIYLLAIKLQLAIAAVFSCEPVWSRSGGDSVASVGYSLPLSPCPPPPTSSLFPHACAPTPPPTSPLFPHVCAPPPPPPTSPRSRSPPVPLRRQLGVKQVELTNEACFREFGTVSLFQSNWTISRLKTKTKTKNLPN